MKRREVQYKQTGRKLPYPRVEWQCSCGFKLALMEGYNPDFNSSDYGAIISPEGVCKKCNHKIWVDIDDLEDTRSFKSNYR